MTADSLRVTLTHLDEEGVCSQKEHNAAERLIKTIESGSTEHLKKKELNDLLVQMQEPKATKLMIKLQSHLRGAAVRQNWLDAMYEVTIKLDSATGLKAADSNGKSDPYAKLKMGKKEYTSRTEKKTVSPVWNQEFTYMGKKGTLLAKPLQVQVFDDDKFSFDDKLGGVDVDLRPVLDTLDEKEETVITGNFDTQGSVMLRVSWSWCDDASAQQQPTREHAHICHSSNHVRCRPARLPHALGVRLRRYKPIEVFVGIVSASGLSASDKGGTSDPYAKLRMDGHEYHTATIYKTVNPIWGQEFAWRGKKTSMLSEPLHIKVFDDDVLSRDDKLGEINLDLNPLLDQLDEDEQLEQTVNLDTQGTVKLTFKWIW